MTGRRRTVLILAVAGVILAGAGWALAAPGRPPAASPAAAPRTVDSTWPLLAPAPSAPASAVPAAAPRLSAPTQTPVPVPTPTTVVAPAAAPRPFVQSFAAQPGVRTQPPLPSPTATLSVRANIDGCDRNYGTVSQCVPWTFPPGTTDKCAWLAAHGFKDLVVVGRDRQGLDPEGDGIACFS